MSVIVVVGAQWGDEGKGKVVDIYTESADLVVRYAGGSNAGHTVVVGDEKFIVRLVPSGILHPEKQCVLGQGMVIDPQVLVDEIDGLVARGVSGIETRLRVSDRAHLILPYHLDVDALRERSAGAAAIGTTKKGIGPAYEDKARRQGVRLGELRDLTRLRDRIASALETWAPTLRALGGDVPELDSILGPLSPLADRIVPLLADSSMLVDRAVRSRARVMLEGAQGTLLDVDHGTYPFVTSSSAVAGGAAIGAGIGPGCIGQVVGITKAYTTRVGAGPFPTELHDVVGQHLQQVGAEFGSVTRRPRRTGWIDLPALRYAARVNGLTQLAITKLDVLTGLDTIRAGVAYDTPAGRIEDFPIDDLERSQPVLRDFPGWKEPIGQARRLEDLPAAARAYVRYVEESVGVPVCLVSVSPRRDATILISRPFEAS